MSSFTCTLCNKSYSRHPEYEAHIGSYDHQHRKRLQDLKQLSRDPNAAERARKAERKADAEAGLLKVIDSNNNTTTTSTTSGSGSAKTGGGGSGGGFKKGGFKSSFATVKGPGAAASSTASLVKKNVLGEDDDDEVESATAGQQPLTKQTSRQGSRIPTNIDEAESDTDNEYGEDGTEEAYYDPLKPTGCYDGCAGVKAVPVA